MVQFYKIAPFNWTGIQQGNILDNTNNTGGNTKMTSSNQKIEKYNNLIAEIKKSNNSKNIDGDNNIYKEFDDIEDNNMIKIKSQKIVEKKRKPKIHFKKLECIKDCITNIIIIHHYHFGSKRETSSSSSHYVSSWGNWF